MTIVASSWSGHIAGYPMHVLCQRLKLVKNALKALHHSNYSNIAGRVKAAREELHDIQHAMQTNPGNQNLLTEELRRYKRYRRVLKAESMMYSLEALVSPRC
eukprot:TRINITY_DN31567_c0_g1_i1.p1 TRINITY_DN31567_c0_g1~~TRINITY_DN31567_c0_g1_i1.p1  ORF type:complete len:102 (+),score=17.93 TRINITY_DN31567_c0_g1_i1:127-432(+)